MGVLIPFSIFLGILNFLISWYLFHLDMCVLNIGVAFGIRVEYEVGIVVLILSVLLYLGFKVKSSLRYLILSLFILGLSNLIVRVVFKNICDYINVFNISFNIVDLSIVLICIISAIIILKGKVS